MRLCSSALCAGPMDLSNFRFFDITGPWHEGRREWGNRGTILTLHSCTSSLRGSMVEQMVARDPKRHSEPLRSCQILDPTLQMFLPRLCPLPDRIVEVTLRQCFFSDPLIHVFAFALQMDVTTATRRANIAVQDASISTSTEILRGAGRGPHL